MKLFRKAGDYVGTSHNWLCAAREVDELHQYTRERLVPLYPQQQGFKGGLILTDHSQNKVLSLTLWETEADLKASESSGYLREQLGKLRLCWQRR